MVPTEAPIMATATTDPIIAPNADDPKYWAINSGCNGGMQA